MKPNEFCKELASIAPSLADLAKVGLFGASVERFALKFRCIKRVTPLGVNTNGDDLIALLDGWDVSSIEIGMINFIDKPVNIPSGMQVGLVESDPLVVLTGKGEVVVAEVTGHLLWTVAANGGKCLDATIIAARFLVKRMLGDVDFDDFEAARTTANDCALAAGGIRFISFWSMLVGSDA